MTASLPVPSSLLVLAGGATQPSYRFRLEQYLPGLARLGWSAAVRHTRPSLMQAPPVWLRRFGRSGWRAWAALQGLSQWGTAPVSRADVVLLQRELLHWPRPIAECRIARAAHAVVLDVDDAIHLNYPSDAQGRAPRIDDFARMADLILCGNHELVDYYAPLGRRVEYLPTVVDTVLLAPRDPSAADPRRLVWIGSGSTLPELEALEPALRRVVQAVPAARLRVVADRPPRFSGEPGAIPVDFVAWRPDAERSALDDALVGLMPLADTPFNRGKCGLKLLLYGARGVASVASPTGANRRIVRDGLTGLHANTPAAFAEALIALLNDPARALALGQAAIGHVRSGFSLEAWTPHLHGWLVEMLRLSLDRRRSPRTAQQFSRAEPRRFAIQSSL